MGKEMVLDLQVLNSIMKGNDKKDQDGPGARDDGKFFINR